MPVYNLPIKKSKIYKGKRFGYLYSSGNGCWHFYRNSFERLLVDAKNGKVIFYYENPKDKQ